MNYWIRSLAFVPFVLAGPSFNEIVPNRDLVEASTIKHAGLVKTLPPTIVVILNETEKFIENSGQHDASFSLWTWVDMLRYGGEHAVALENAIKLDNYKKVKDILHAMPFGDIFYQTVLREENENHLSHVLLKDLILDKVGGYHGLMISADDSVYETEGLDDFARIRLAGAQLLNRSAILKNWKNVLNEGQLRKRIADELIEAANRSSNGLANLRALTIGTRRYLDKRAEQDMENYTDIDELREEINKVVLLLPSDTAGDNFIDDSKGPHKHGDISASAKEPVHVMSNRASASVVAPAAAPSSATELPSALPNFSLNEMQIREGPKSRPDVVSTAAIQLIQAVLDNATTLLSFPNGDVRTCTVPTSIHSTPPSLPFPAISKRRLAPFSNTVHNTAPPLTAVIPLPLSTSIVSISTRTISIPPQNSNPTLGTFASVGRHEAPVYDASNPANPTQSLILKTVLMPTISSLQSTAGLKEMRVETTSSTILPNQVPHDPSKVPAHTPSAPNLTPPILDGTLERSVAPSGN